MKNSQFILTLMAGAAFGLTNTNAEELPSCGENCTYSYVENGTDDSGNTTYTLTISPIDASKPAEIKDYDRYGQWGHGGEHAPWRFENVTNVEITEGITSVGSDAFTDMQSIKSVTLPEGLEKIGGVAFHNLPFLTKIDLPSSLIEISSWAFSDDPLTEINGLSEHLTSIGSNAFGMAKITDFVISPNVVNLATDAFGLAGWTSYEAKNLTNLYCPESLMSECAAAIAYRGDDAEVKSYAFDGGVYVIGDDYYLSGDDMKKGDTASSAEEKAQYVCAGTLNHCKKQALINRGICQDADCDALVASDGNYMLKFGGKTYQSINDLLKGNYDKRRIYTIEEANFVAGDKNRVSITYR